MTAANPTDSVREFLYAALHELITRPWIQHATRREDGGVCAAGALFAAQVTARRHGQTVPGSCLLDAHDRLERAATDLAGGTATVTVPTYNDYYADTKADVIRLYKKAIHDCEPTTGNSPATIRPE